MPLKAIELAGKSFRRYGDMLEYGNFGKHQVPKFSTTVVSPDDYVLKFLQREADDTKAHLLELLKLFALHLIQAFRDCSVLAKN